MVFIKKSLMFPCLSSFLRFLLPLRNFIFELCTKFLTKILIDCFRVQIIKDKE